MTNSQTTYTINDVTRDRYTLNIIATARAHDIQQGAEIFLTNPGRHKSVVIALMEYEQGLIGDDYLDIRDQIQFNSQPLV